MSTRRPVALLVVLLTVAAAPAVAQSSMGNVDGTVSDAQGGVLPGATVTLTSVTTNVQSVRVTNDRGYFTFVNVRPASYTLTIELQGFKTQRIAPFAVGVNETVSR